MAYRNILLVGLLVLWTPMLAVAADKPVEHAVAAEPGDTNASHGNAHEGGLNWMDLSDTETPPLIPMFLNLIIVGVITYLLLRKGLGAKIRARRSELESALAEANALKTEAEAAIAAAQARSEALEKEMAQIRTDVLEAAKAQAAQLEQHAQLRAERMQADATALIAQETAMMATQIRQEVVEEIVALAEKQIVQRLQSADQDTLAKEYVSKVMASFQEGK